MKHGCLGSLLVLLVSGVLPAGQPPATPEAVPSPKPTLGAPEPLSPPQSSAAPAERPTLQFEPIVNDSQPWSPPVGYANVWPYKDALKVGNPDCEPAGDLWLRADYLFWAIKGRNLPALATTATPVRGTLGSPQSVLVGTDLDPGAFNGGRFTAGTWLNDEHTFSMEGTFFFLGLQTERFDLLSGGPLSAPLLARPFTNVLTGAEEALLVASPGHGPEKIHASASSIFQGAEANGIYQLYCCSGLRVEVLGGFRYQDLTEELDINDIGRLAADTGLLGAHQVGVFDQFHTRNVFFGGQLGARAEYQWHHLFVDLKTMLALGGNGETIHIAGATFASGRRRPIALAGGLLALPSNSGRATDYEFSAIPDIGLQVGYEFNPHVRVFAGYNFLYWSDVARPTEQLPVAVNPRLVPALRTAGALTGSAPLTFAPRQTDFWAQGLNLGMEVRY